MPLEIRLVVVLRALVRDAEVTPGTAVHGLAFDDVLEDAGGAGGILGLQPRHGGRKRRFWRWLWRLKCDEQHRYENGASHVRDYLRCSGTALSKPAIAHPTGAPLPPGADVLRRASGRDRHARRLGRTRRLLQQLNEWTPIAVRRPPVPGPDAVS